MRTTWMRRAAVCVLATVVGTGGSITLIGASPAQAAPHLESAQSVQVGWTDSATPRRAYDAVDDVNLPIGTRVDADGKAHTSRVYATFDLTPFAGTKPYNGTVFFRETDVPDCGKRAIEIWRTRAVDATPTWRRAPEALTKLDEITTTTVCPNASISFDVGAAIRDAINRDQRRVTFEIRVPAAHEADPTYARSLYWFRNVQLTVEYNRPPTMDNQHLYNAGFACAQSRPYPRFGSFANVLQALGRDQDEDDNVRLTHEFAVWPVGDPAARQVFGGRNGSNERVSTVTMPEDALADGGTYGWQARISDGADTSAWSKKCYFTVDRTRPVNPIVTSANYPEGGQAPAGEPARFTFSGGGDPDVAGFRYSWGYSSGTSCEYGDLGVLTCPDPFSVSGTVRADQPGGIADVTLSPADSGRTRLIVQSIDRAGNRSDEVVYEMQVPWSSPTVTVDGDAPRWNETVRLRAEAAAGVTGVQEFTFTYDDREPVTVPADENGVAYYSFPADRPDQLRVTVTSRSANGFESGTELWVHYFDPWPGVSAEVAPAGSATTFTLTPPPGETDVARYRWRISGETEDAYVDADSNGRATVSWTPAEAGSYQIRVSAFRADGEQAASSHRFDFEIPAA